MLNAAVRAYLVQEGYKLTALTLSEEGSGSISEAAPQPGGTLADIFQNSARQAAAASAQQVSLRLAAASRMNKCTSTYACNP